MALEGSRSSPGTPAPRNSPAHRQASTAARGCGRGTAMRAHRRGARIATGGSWCAWTGASTNPPLAAPARPHPWAHRTHAYSPLGGPDASIRRARRGKRDDGCDRRGPEPAAHDARGILTGASSGRGATDPALHNGSYPGRQRCRPDKTANLPFRAGRGSGNWIR